MSGPVLEWICAHLRACEESLLDAAVRRDRAQVAELLAEDFQEFGASGRVWTRAEVLDLLETEEYQPPSIEQFTCRPIAEGAMLVTYRAVRGDGSVTLRSSLWAVQEQKWRVVFHQGTKAR